MGKGRLEKAFHALREGVRMEVPPDPGLFLEGNAEDYVALSMGAWSQWLMVTMNHSGLPSAGLPILDQWFSLSRRPNTVISRFLQHSFPGCCWGH